MKAHLPHINSKETGRTLCDKSGFGIRVQNYYIAKNIHEFEKWESVGKACKRCTGIKNKDPD